MLAAAPLARSGHEATRTSSDRPRCGGWTPRWTRCRAVVPRCGYGGGTSLPYAHTARRLAAEPRVLGSHLPPRRRLHRAALRGLRDPGGGHGVAQRGVHSAATTPPRLDVRCAASRGTVLHRIAALTFAAPACCRRAVARR